MERFRYDRSSKWLIEHQGHLILFHKSFWD